MTICNSYNAECTARMLKSIELGNISDVYSVTNTMKFNTSNDMQKHMLWMQYVVWHCNGYSRGLVSDYVNSPVFQELLHELKYFEDDSDEKVYIARQSSIYK